ncbi:MAG: 1-acyl-sn-glycerol-3-phosphate acyltransferase [Thermomicrobiales bacterium]|nr:MAG: 1-acyl-sn-glycerol-3-phosphate acyltransferase [Thermomicrobiales bacterium]
MDVERYTLRGRPRRVVRAILLAVVRRALHLQIEHLERIPPAGPVIVYSNHLHNADPILMVMVFPRPIHYMAKKEVFHVPVIKWIVRMVGAFPVDRGKADRNAIRRAEAALAAGVAVGMFPEGTRSETLALRQAHAGTGLLALRNDVPVLPVAITGTERLPFNGAKGRLQAQHQLPDPGHRGVRIVFGEPFRIPREILARRTTPEDATEIMMIKLAQMLPPDYRGVYADKVTSAPIGTGEPAQVPEQPASVQTFR